MCVVCKIGIKKKRSVQEGILTGFLKPKYAPTKVRGTEMPNHSARMATSVPKGTAAEEPSTHRIRFIRKKSTNTILQKHKPRL